MSKTIFEKSVPGRKGFTLPENEINLNMENYLPTKFFRKEEIKLPISLWSLALEIHTARIFEPIIGIFYILIIPILGMTTLLILVTGFMMWAIASRRKIKSNN